MPKRTRGWMGLAGLAVSATLAACATASGAGAPDISQPEEITFGASLAQMTATLDGACATADVRNFDPPQIPDATTHDQIDCQGFDYFGAPRLAEFVFMDDRLVLVWILVEREDLPALEAAFVSAHGEPSHVGAEIKGFAGARAAVRSDVPEALYYWEQIAPLVESRMLGDAS